MRKTKTTLFLFFPNIGKQKDERLKLIWPVGMILKYMVYPPGLTVACRFWVVYSRAGCLLFASFCPICASNTTQGYFTRVLSQICSQRFITVFLPNYLGISTFYLLGRMLRRKNECRV